jgi:hypothetical protein
MIKFILLSIKKLLFREESDFILYKGSTPYIRATALIEQANHPCIFPRFHGVPIPVVVRRLTGIQRKACGDFSLIETVRDRIERKGTPTIDEMLRYSRTQYNILKKSLVSPSYEEIMKMNEFDDLRLEAEKELKELEPIINGMPDGIEKNKLLLSYRTAQMESEFLLPADFIADVIAYALHVDDSDLDDITSSILYDAALMAKHGHDNPSDHMSGSFQPHHLEDIDRRAWAEFYRKEKGKNGSSN